MHGVQDDSELDMSQYCLSPPGSPPVYACQGTGLTACSRLPGLIELMHDAQLALQNAHEQAMRRGACWHQVEFSEEGGEGQVGAMVGQTIKSV